ncbi:MAG TPA: glycosyl hydrolase family 28 protein [Sphingomicrobium sp.]|jgi:polygalacturonase
MFDVHAFGAAGNGETMDTVAIQRAIDAAGASGGGARVLLRAGHIYLTGLLRLVGGIDFHLEGDAQLRVSADPAEYRNHEQGVLHAMSAHNLTISGTGSIDGRSREFMERFDEQDEWWIPKPFRPRLLVLEDCEDLRIRDLTFKQAPLWTVHLIGCRRVLIDYVTIDNQLDVPNCDGIDPDHCQDVEIRDCRITCGDDAIVVKTTAGHERYGASRNIHVHDCVLHTQDSGLKIGTETVQDIHDLLFERIEIISGCRGLCIQLRDEGTVRDIVFRDIAFVSRYHSAPWWGRGEAISFTAIPRNADTKVGTIRNILVQNVRGTAENSIRIEGLGGARVSDIRLENVDVTLERSTRYSGAVYDNRPTEVVQEIEPHSTVGISIRHADRIVLTNCRIQWSDVVPEYFSHAIQALDAPGLSIKGFQGVGANFSETVNID